MDGIGERYDRAASELHWERVHALFRRHLLMVDAATRLGPLGTTEMTRLWQQKCEPTPVWGDFRDFAADFGDRSQWQAMVKMLDGHR